MKTYVFSPTENVDADELRVFMFCGMENIPKECLCGCGNNRLFAMDEQMKNYNKKNAFRFYHNDNHIKRFKIRTTECVAKAMLDNFKY